VAIKVKWVAGATLERSILSPEWIKDAGDISAVVGVFDVSAKIIVING
jgi:hypothetical protein